MQMIPAAALGANDRIRVAVIGVRGRGRAIAGGLPKIPGVSVEALVDVDPRVFANAVKAVEAAGGKPPRTLSDMRRVFDDKNIDAVAIATPDHWHAPAAILACAAGKDVYLEKPAAHNAREAWLVVEAARRHKRIVQHGTQARSREITIKAIDYARSGKIGELRMAKAWDVQRRSDIGHKPDSPVPPGVDYDTWTGPALMLPFNENRFHYTWHWNWNYGTGDMGNDGAHQLDMARWALGVGLPTEVAGLARKVHFQDDQQTPDSMSIAFGYPDPRKMLLFEMRIWNPYGMEDCENGLGLYGDGGWVQVARWNRVWGFKVFDEQGKQVLYEQGPGEDLPHLANFFDCMRSRQAPNADIAIGYDTVMHCHLGNIVARTGRAVRFDATARTITGDPAAAKLLGREYRRHWAAPA